MQGTLLMLHLQPYGMSKHNYGPDVLDFKPTRWMSESLNTTLGLAESVAPTQGPDVFDTVAASSAAAASSADTGGGVKGLPPDPITFLTGPRDW